MGSLKPTLMVCGHTAPVSVTSGALALVKAAHKTADAVALVLMPEDCSQGIEIEHALWNDGFAFKRIFWRQDSGVRHCLVCHAREGDTASMRGRHAHRMTKTDFLSNRS